MKLLRSPFAGPFSLLVGCQFAILSATQAAPVHGWLTWRGPTQNGASLETNLPDKVDAGHPLWTANLPGQSTPVIANGSLYVIGYVVDGQDFMKYLTCFLAGMSTQIC